MPLQAVSESIQTQPFLLFDSLSKKSLYLHRERYQLSTTSKISQLLAIMFAAVMKLSTPSGPLFKIAGIRLTKNDTNQLIQDCNALVGCMDKQIEAIRSLPNLPDLRAGRLLHIIQVRQKVINTLVAAIISQTALSACPWINEFADARTALDGKIRTINKFSEALGWVPAARRLWPCMMETYEWLEPLTLKLREEAEEALQELQEEQDQLDRQEEQDQLEQWNWSPLA